VEKGFQKLLKFSKDFLHCIVMEKKSEFWLSFEKMNVVIEKEMRKTSFFLEEIKSDSQKDEKSFSKVLLNIDMDDKLKGLLREKIKCWGFGVRQIHIERKRENGHDCILYDEELLKNISHFLNLGDIGPGLEFILTWVECKSLLIESTWQAFFFQMIIGQIFNSIYGFSFICRLDEGFMQSVKKTNESFFEFTQSAFAELK
jgi:hypothetical protein